MRRTYTDDIAYMYSPRLSRDDIDKAIQYANDSVKIEPSEVGKEVYDVLIAEKIREYLGDI